ncbi:hypothetical protein AALP_AA8G172100 [Arabis alpina]|uniref:Uncharacterized protein n=1 Tax=Arabis alpina TaxID=50452 RepID=A0A087G7L2_ARAAL|nr:hypothetical protein AALP_AA8G172100 [Arabis alpina]
MKDQDNDLKIPEPLRADWFMVLVTIQADLIYNALVVLTSPLLLLYRSYRRAASTVSAAEKAVKRAPSRITSGAAWAVRRTWFGLMGACHVSMVMVVAVILAAVVGFGMKNWFISVESRASIFERRANCEIKPTFWFSKRSTNIENRCINAPREMAKNKSSESDSDSPCTNSVIASIIRSRDPYKLETAMD